MKLTNKLNLPQPLFDAVNNDSYTPGQSDVSVTQLIAPLQQLFLERKHWDDLTEDVSDRIWSLGGQSIHTILERAERTGIKERRLYFDIDGIKIGGQFDRLALMSVEGGITGLLQDYKWCSVWEYIYGIKQYRVEQLNIYSFLLKSNNYNVSKLEVVMVFRDWQMSRAKRDKTYPQQQIAIINIPLWSITKTLEFIEYRVGLYKECLTGNIPECTNEERWYSGDKYAVKKKGNKKAKRVFDTKTEAAKYIEENDTKFTIEYRPGENRRCENYCQVKEFCEQYNRLSEGKNGQ